VWFNIFISKKTASQSLIKIPTVRSCRTNHCFAPGRLEFDLAISSPTSLPSARNFRELLLRTVDDYSITSHSLLMIINQPPLFAQAVLVCAKISSRRDAILAFMYFAVKMLSLWSLSKFCDLHRCDGDRSRIIEAIEVIAGSALHR
jgi:hypothetical protein